MNRSKLVLPVAIGLLGSIVGIAAALPNPYTRNPTDDEMIFGTSGSADTGNASGAGPGLLAGADGSLNIKRSLILFDPSALGSVTVTTAHLDLWIGQIAGTGGGGGGGGCCGMSCTYPTRNFAIYPSTTAWHEGHVGNTACSGSPCSSMGGTGQGWSYTTCAPSSTSPCLHDATWKYFDWTGTVNTDEWTNDVWMSGGQSIQHWDGSTLSAVAIPDLAANAALTTMGYAQRNDVWWWASHAGQFVHWDGTAMTSTAVTVADGNAISCGALVDHTYWLAGAYGEVAAMDTPFHVRRIIDGTFLWNDFNGIWGTADDDMYVAVGSELRHWDGTTLTTIPLETGAETMLVGLAGIQTQGVDELFVTAYKLDPGPIMTWSIFHFDGTTWTKTVVGSGPVGTPINAPWKIFILGPGEAMAVGLNGYAGYFASGTWQQITTNTTQELTGVFGPDPDHVWVSGLAGTVLRWDRANPTVLTQAPDVVTTADLGPIAGSPGDTWIASAATGTMWHNAGSGWTEIADTYLGNGVHVGAVSSGDYNGGLIFSDAMHGWVASEVQNHTFRWNGSTWTYNDLGATRGMPRIIQPAGSKLWAGGNSGVIFHP